jgi:hypothetical protein
VAALSIGALSISLAVVWIAASRFGVPVAKQIQDAVRSSSEMVTSRIPNPRLFDKPAMPAWIQAAMDRASAMPGTTTHTKR